jgi:hypothetical protein
VKFAAVLLLALALSACATTQPADNRPDEPSAAFPDQPEDDAPLYSGPGKPVIIHPEDNETDRARWDWYTDVLKFRGVKMPRLLRELESKNAADWNVVRDQVQPPVKRPSDWPPELVKSHRETQSDGTTKLIEKRIPLTKEQEAYRHYRMWPKEIREKLQGTDWNSAKSREWLVEQGRLYALVYDFDIAQPLPRADRETDRWLDFADSMLSHGAEGEHMLISNMIVRLGHDQQDFVQNAHVVLVRVGPSTIEPLMDALWVTFGGNPDFNKNVVSVLADFRERAVGPAITELQLGPRGGVTWRSRKSFVDLLGMLRDARGIRAITEEIEKTDITEYRFPTDDDGKPLWGKGPVPDPKATEYAVFTFHEYCIAALGAIGKTEGIKPIVALWEKDPDHVDGAQSALYAITGKRVDNLSEAKALAAKYK